MKLLSLLVIFYCHGAIVVGVFATRNWETAFDLADKIMSDYRALEEEDLFLQLAEVKKSINSEVTREIPPKYMPERMQSIVPVIALIRLIDLGVKKCYEVPMSVLNGHLHRSVYIDLAPFLREIFEGDTMRQLIDFYYRGQLMLCRNALASLMDSKSNEYLNAKAESPLLVSFVSMLDKSFSQDYQFKDLELIQKYAAISVALSNRLTKYSLENALINQGWRNELKKRAVLNECQSYIFEPFGTLLRSYDIVGRHNLPEVYNKHMPIIRAYDLCKAVVELQGHELINVLQSMQTILFAKKTQPSFIGQFQRSTSQLEPLEKRQNINLPQNVQHQQQTSVHLERSTSFELPAQSDSEPELITNTNLELGKRQR